MMRFSIFMTIVFWSSIPGFGQHQIQGTIKDDQGAPLPFSNVLLLTDSGTFVKGAVADINGGFTFLDIKTGSYGLTISAIGYDDFQQTVEINEHLDLGTILISKNTIALEEVTVLAKKVAFVRKADRTIVHVSSLPTAAGGNALDLIEKSPSVRVDRVNSDFSLMGKTGVLVFINGRRTRLDGNDLLQYLTSIPAANIQSLELIHNPPASYDADGTGGIINIVLKNYEADGFNGSANVFSGYGQRGKYGGSLVFNYKSDQLNLYGDASTTQDYTAQNSEMMSSIQFNDGLLTTDQISKRPAYLGNYSGKLGLDYAITPNTSVDVFGSYARRRWAMIAETTTDYSGEISPIQNDLLGADETNTTNQYHLSSRIQQKFKNGHTLSANYDYLNFNIVNPTSYQLSNFNDNHELVSSETFETRKETPFDFHVGRVDYIGHLNDAINFEVGLKATLSQLENNTLLTDENNIPSENPLFTDALDLEEQIYAAYFSIEGSLGKKYTFTGGLRYEESDLALTSLQGDVDRQITRIFPTVNITRNFSEVSRLTVAYRERIGRLGFRNLAPAFFFLNPYTVLAGNIQAQPNINRTVGLTLNHQSLFIALSYSNDDNPNVRGAIPQLNQEDNLLLLISDNIESRHQVVFNMGFPIKMTNFWNTRYSIESYWRRDAVFFDETKIIESNPFLSIDVSQNFQFPKNWSIELSGRWNSRTYQGTIYQPQQTFINLGIQKKLKNGTLGLSWTDIFDTGSFLGFINELPEQGVVYDWNYDFEGRIVRLSYSYNFGGQVKQSRGSGASDVLERVNK